MKLIQGNFGGDNSGSYSAEVTEAGKLKISVAGEFDVSAKVRALAGKVSGDGFFPGLIRGGLNSLADSLTKKAGEDKGEAKVASAATSGPVPSELA